MRDIPIPSPRARVCTGTFPTASVWPFHELLLTSRNLFSRATWLQASQYMLLTKLIAEIWQGVQRRSKNMKEAVRIKVENSLFLFYSFSISKGSSWNWTTQPMLSEHRAGWWWGLSSQEISAQWREGQKKIQKGERGHLCVLYLLTHYAVCRIKRQRQGTSN